MGHRDWQEGGLTPKGYGVYCTGCRHCAAEGHVPFPRLTERTEDEKDALFRERK
jgi:hypothetical protein